ncbi:MAG TPA: ribulose 1,5-bisphosphate carboxylase large subunit, partial [Actinobacteria bacterium]|nr:ribulose 1,5-bisphosphate carboxylase large subunit [Actinomycetota bacterium]
MTAAASGDLIEIDYRITAENPRAIADAIRVEQTIEFPFELAPEWIQQDVVGQVLNDDTHDITIGYDPGVAGGGLVQVLNLLWGNVSLFPGVRVRGLRLPDSILDDFRGPRFG